jgi:putative membrane protein
MKIRILAASAAALGLVACGGSDSANQSSPTESDAVAGNAAARADAGAMNNMAAPAAAPAANGQEYATRAAASDLFEIESARLATEKARSPDIKAFAQMLIGDHQKSTNDLKDAAQKAQPAITVAPALDPEQQSMMQALKAAGSEEFDRTFTQQQVQAHQKALALVQSYAQSGDVPSLKQHASTVAGPIQQHLQRAQQLAGAAGTAR